MALESVYETKVFDLLLNFHGGVNHGAPVAAFDHNDNNDHNGDLYSLFPLTATTTPYHKPHENFSSIQRNRHHRNSIAPGFYSATTTPYIGATGDDFSNPINNNFLFFSPIITTPTSPSLSRFDLHPNPPVVPSQLGGGLSTRQSTTNSITDSIIISPELTYLSSPILIDTPASFFPPLASTSPRVEQTPSYSSEILSTAPSTAVNTPYTGPLSTFTEEAALNSNNINNITSSSTPSIEKSTLLNKPKRPRVSNPFAELNFISPSSTLTINMASVSPTNTVDKPTEEKIIGDVDLSTIIQDDGQEESSKTTVMNTSPVTTVLSDQTNPRPVPIRPRPDEDQKQEAPRKRRKSDDGSMEIDQEGDSEPDDANGKTYVCSKCGRGFQRKFNMQTHESTHDPNRVKPFACDFPSCGSRFTRKHDLKRHINGIHKGEKVHECNACQKPFSRKDAWKRHQSSCGKN
ncbi:4043_t:CDS:2 [Ambispora gerdemannii]|uniref:4043_t:CDS:1 n=1 Tax=Ambispora gerdemannii TaxID=144530 RepID=A0A9N8VME6_9GLOM|nr:4043_t:CDS:2 [Ambispora gerdemannii]